MIPKIKIKKNAAKNYLAAFFTILFISD